MKTPLILLLFFVLTENFNGQIVSNGNFSSGTTSWGCGVEINAESVYGGGTSNAVAEVDAAAGLCQTITGLTIGNVYVISVNASRRTGGCPSPATTNVNLTVSGGVLSTTITRTNTTFGYTNDAFLFTANSTNHTITFGAGAGFGGSTCGMIMDDIAVAFSPLPIELLFFEGTAEDKNINFTWATASESNNDFFEIERSENGIDFTGITTVPSKALNGNSSVRLTYKSEYPANSGDLNYYRLKQTDFDKSYSFSTIIALSCASRKNSISIYPNPNKGEFSVSCEPAGPVTLSLINYLGQEVHSQSIYVEKRSNPVELHLQEKLSAGVYQCILYTHNWNENHLLIIE